MHHEQRLLHRLLRDVRQRRERLLRRRALVWLWHDWRRLRIHVTAMLQRPGVLAIRERYQFCVPPPMQVQRGLCRRNLQRQLRRQRLRHLPSVTEGRSSTPHWMPEVLAMVWPTAFFTAVQRSVQSAALPHTIPTSSPVAAAQRQSAARLFCIEPDRSRTRRTSTGLRLTETETVPHVNPPPSAEPYGYGGQPGDPPASPLSMAAPSDSPIVLAAVGRTES